MAGRPSLAPGTYGKIRFLGRPPSVRAIARVRDYDGVTRQVERTGKSEAAAERNLKEHLRDRIHADPAGEITADSWVRDLAEVWWAEFIELDKSPGTLRLYRDRLDNQVTPGLGSLRVRELTTGAANRLLKTVTKSNGASVAKATRTVLSAMCGYACRVDALKINPIREVATIKVTPQRLPVALEVAEVRQLRAYLTYDPIAIRRDLLDLVDVMLATGLRIGEALAITWASLDLTAGTVEVRGTVIRERGKGLRIKPSPKTKAGFRKLILPSWAVELFTDRHNDQPEDQTVFCANSCRLRDPDNVSTWLREAFDKAGYEDLVSHTFRKTVATEMDRSGRTAREIADQLGQAQISITQDVYLGRKARDTGAAAAVASFL